MVLKLGLFLIFLIIEHGRVYNLDPCISSGLSTFPTEGIGLRNEYCTIPDTHDQICDNNLEDTMKWYIIEDGGRLLNHCPSKGSCGNAYPAWMNGSYPTEEDGEVNMTTCIKINNDCCKDHVAIKVKNCSRFIAYYLGPLKECPSAYCVESDIPCSPQTTGTQSSTSSARTTVPTGGAEGKSTAVVSGISISVSVSVVTVIILWIVLRRRRIRKNEAQGPFTHSVASGGGTDAIPIVHRPNQWPPAPPPPDLLERNL